MSDLEVVQVYLHVVKKLQDPVLQDIKETFQGVELLVHQLENNRKVSYNEMHSYPLCYFTGL